MKLTPLKFRELKEINGGNPAALWRWARTIYTALDIQDKINEVRAGWNSVKC